MDVTLHYFDARGRAQFLRYYFACRGIDFVDSRVPLSADFSEWAAVRDDRSMTGPFRRLPVLIVDGIQLAETPVIAADVHARFGDSATLGEEANRHHAMLQSSLYVDLMMPFGQLVWADRFYPGLDLAGHLAFMLRRLEAYLATLDEALSDWSWLASLDQRNLMVADCLLWEELDMLETILADAVDLARFPTLATFYRECPGRDTFLQYIAAHPCQFTGRPGESDAITHIRKTLGEMKEEQQR